VSAPSAPASAPEGGAGEQPPSPVATEACPLCGAPLLADQDWCLRCGAAARTRLAAAPRWRGPVITLAVVVVLALGVLVASLVRLAGDSGPAPQPVTHTVTTPAAATAPATTAPATTAPATTTPATPAGTAGTPGAAATTTGARSGSSAAARARRRLRRLRRKTGVNSAE